MRLSHIHNGCIDWPRTTVSLDLVVKECVDNTHKWFLGLKPSIHYILKFGIGLGTKSLYLTITGANWFFEHALHLIINNLISHTSIISQKMRKKARIIVSTKTELSLKRGNPPKGKRTIKHTRHSYCNPSQNTYAISSLPIAVSSATT